MSDTLLPWQIQYIIMLREGKMGNEALRTVGATLEEFSNARMNNAAFKAELEMAEAGIGCTTITAEELRKLREAQVTEPRVAAYFGVTIEELKIALDKDEKLKRVYDTGVGRGQAIIQMAQFDAAVEGNSDAMLKKLGEEHLGQSDKMKHEITISDAIMKMQEIDSKLQQIKVSKQMKIENSIEGEFEEIEDEAKDSE